MPLVRIIGPALLFIVVFLGGAQLQNTLSGRVNVDGQQPLYERLAGYNAEDVSLYWSALGPEGQAAEKKFLILDLLFPVLYGGTLLWALWFYWDASEGTVFGIGFNLAALAVVLLVLSDLTENTGQILELGRLTGGEAVRPAVIGLASLATMLKLWLAIACFGLLLIGAGSMASRSRR